MAPTYDLLVFGATGFTGKRVAEEASRNSKDLRWAVAGRSRERLDALVASLPAGGSAPGVVLADVADAGSLAAMARATRLLINTVGPFRFFGEQVVKACVEAGTDYLDVCGEPEFIERVELEYDAPARASGSLVASAVGFDSVPGDLGTAFTLSQFQPPARCTLVEAVISLKGGEQGIKGHFPTYESAVEGFGSAGELRELRKRAAAARGQVDLKVPGPKPKRQTGPAFEPRLDAWTLPFMGADASVVRRTMAARVREGKPAANVSFSFSLPSKYCAYQFGAYGAVFQFMAGRGWGRSLLKRFPGFFTSGLFTHEGPSEQQLRETSFEITFFGKGYSQGAPSRPDEQPDLSATTKVSGPEPGYVACSIFVVQAALAVLQERGQLGVPGGVFTPASLLANSTYVERLQRRGIAFDVVKPVGPADQLPAS